jgi:hypothetical protein
MESDALSRLVQLIPPPAIQAINPRDWVVAEITLGTTLPADYKSFLDTYGPGELAGFICVWDPFLDLVGWRKSIHAYLDADREARDNCLDQFAGPIFPEPCGRLPWGSTGNGDLLWWDTTGSPADWTVVVWESRGPDHQAFPFSMSEFLFAWVSGTINVCVATDHFIRQAGPVFLPLQRVASDPTSQALSTPTNPNAS